MSAWTLELQTKLSALRDSNRYFISPYIFSFFFFILFYFSLLNLSTSFYFYFRTWFYCFCFLLLSYNLSSAGLFCFIPPPHILHYFTLFYFVLFSFFYFIFCLSLRRAVWIVVLALARLKTSVFNRSLTTSPLK